MTPHQNPCRRRRGPRTRRLPQSRAKSAGDGAFLRAGQRRDSAGRKVCPHQINGHGGDDGVRHRE